MWRNVFVCSVLVCGTVMGLDKLISKGKWMVENVAKCANPEQYEFDFEFRKKKMNRTHDGFDANMELPSEINNDYGAYVEACIKVDGGCKLVQVLVDPKFCDFIMRYAADNFKKALEMAGLPPDCPISKGHHKIENYMFDYEELPEEGMIGEFQATAYLTKGDDRLACVSVDLYFTNDDNDDDDEE